MQLKLSNACSIAILFAGLLSSATAFSIKNTGSTAPMIKLTYFGIEGVAEKVRLAFVLAGIEFEDDRVDGERWKTLKPQTPYGQLPIMYVDEKAMTQSDAMLRFAGRLDTTGTLYPEELHASIDEAIGLCADMEREWRPAVYIGMQKGLEAFGYPDDIDKDAIEGLKKKLREQFLENDMDRFLGYFEAILTKTEGPFLFGSEPTIADCMLLPLLRTFQRGYIEYVPVTCLDSNAVVCKYITDMLEVPKIKAWYSK